MHLLPLENVPSEDLKARSRFWLPALSNGTKIAGICADDSSVPCWRPEWSDTPDRLIDDYPEARSLTVIRDGSSYWVVVKNVYDKEPPRFSWELRPASRRCPE